VATGKWLPGAKTVLAKKALDAGTTPGFATLIRSGPSGGGEFGGLRQVGAHGSEKMFIFPR
jgi:hypothetical protein